MTDDEICKRLRQADAALHVLSAGSRMTPSDELIASVRAKLRRRRRQQAVYAAMAMTLLALAGWRGWRHRDEGSRPAVELTEQRPERSGGAEASPSSKTDHASDIAQLEAEANRLSEMARALTLARQLAEVKKWLTEVAEPRTAQDYFAEGIEVAAGIGMAKADRLRASESRLVEAAAAYEAIIEKFPQTHWAAVARERLSTLPLIQMN